MARSVGEALHARVETLRHARSLGGLATHRVGERLQAGDLRVRAVCRSGQPLLVALPAREVLGVRTPVLDESTGGVLGFAVDVDDARDRVVQQVEVVAHDDQRTAERPQQREEPGAGVGIEMVGGLVEE